ncbi:hypothetical protein [Winogradskyella bathintestinalis]|uniref:Uncharacterized protein n=1 Tax=Winogradskyella bathintestinalis TaxID=3035208 RepID=A0ABT7ZSM8_9FLAO|nr:hypothetical protein [Winogradskyella bathintestinalis]MDN3492003.1 hypothetical protein [Winogradskyella bathintestinalis]
MAIVLTSVAMSQQKIHIDEKGNTVSASYFQEKWRHQDLGLSRWDSIGSDGKRYNTLKEDLYRYGKFDYSDIKTEIENITSLKISDSSLLIIEYYYKNDLCTDTRNNRWTRTKINSRKKFTNPIRTKLNKKDIIFICLFEKGIELNNKRNKLNEYFFLDRNNYFRTHIFLKSTLCGSYAAIRPNGETLLRNGEYRADLFAEHLKSENWTLFFGSKD